MAVRSTNARLVRVELGPAPGVEDDEAKVGGLGPGAGPAHPLFFNRFRRLAQPGGVGQDYRIAGEIEMDLDDIARRPGQGRYDRRLAPGDAVQQARFADIGCP